MTGVVNDETVEALVFIKTYAGHVDDWLVIKRELLKVLKPAQRSGFSTRDPITKAQVINEHDRAVASIWSELTGRPVIFTTDERT